MLGTPGNRALDVAGLQLLFKGLLDLGDVGLTFWRALCDEPFDLRVNGRIERLEGKILKLPLNGVHAEPMGKRGVYLQRFARLARGVLLTDILPCAGVVQAIGQFDKENANVLGHRDHHLANCLRLRGLAVLHLVQLGDAINE